MFQRFDTQDHVDTFTFYCKEQMLELSAGDDTAIIEIVNDGFCRVITNHDELTDYTSESPELLADRVFADMARAK